MSTDTLTRVAENEITQSDEDLVNQIDKMHDYFLQFRRVTEEENNKIADKKAIIKKYLKNAEVCKFLAKELRKTLSSSYAVNESHKMASELAGYKENYFQEIIQNGNDAAMRIENSDADKKCDITVGYNRTENYYTVECSYPDEGFSLKDVFGFVSKNATGKDKEKNATGGFGIGIKSVLSFAKTFSITSNVLISYEQKTKAEDADNSSIKYNYDWKEGDKTVFSFTFTRDNNENGMNKNKLANFIDKCLSGGSLDKNNFIFDGSLENLIMDMRALLFMGEKGFRELNFYSASESGEPIKVVSIKKEIVSQAETMENVSQTETVENVSGTETKNILVAEHVKLSIQQTNIYGSPSNTSMDYIVVHNPGSDDDKPDDLRNAAFCMNNLSLKDVLSPIWNPSLSTDIFSTYFVRGFKEGYYGHVLLDTTSVNSGRDSIDGEYDKVFSPTKLGKIGLALAKAAAITKNNAEPDMAYTQLLVWLMMYSEKNNDEWFFHEEDDFSLANYLSEVYIGMDDKGEKYDRVFQWDTGGLYKTLCPAYEPGGDANPVFGIFKEITENSASPQKYKDGYIGKIENSGEDVINRIINCVRTSKEVSLLRNLPVLSCIKDVLEYRDVTPTQINKFPPSDIKTLKKLMGRAGFSDYSTDGTPTKVAVIGYLVSGEQQGEHEFDSDYGILRYCAQAGGYVYKMKYRDKSRYSPYPYYYSDIKQVARSEDSNPDFDKDDCFKALLNLASLLGDKSIISKRLIYIEWMQYRYLIDPDLDLRNGIKHTFNEFPKNTLNNCSNARVVDLQALILGIVRCVGYRSFNDLRRMWEKYISIIECFTNEEIYCDSTNAYGLIRTLSDFNCIQYKLSKDDSISDFLYWLSGIASKFAKLSVAFLNKYTKILPPTYLNLDSILSGLKIDLNNCNMDVDDDPDYKDLSDFIKKHILTSGNANSVKIINPITEGNSVSGYYYGGHLKINISGKPIEIGNGQSNAISDTLYIFIGSASKKFDEYKSIRNNLVSALNIDENNDNSILDLLNNFIFAGRTYNVTTEDFNTLTTRKFAQVNYRHQKLANANWKSRIPSRVKLGSKLMRSILLGPGSYDRHCPFCGSSFDSGTDDSENLSQIKMVVIPIGSEGEEKKYLPTIMCSACLKRFRHITSATLGENKKEVHIKIVFSDSCRKHTEEILSIPISPDNLAIFDVFNS